MSMRLETRAKKRDHDFSAVDRAHFGEFMNGSWNFHTSLAKYLTQLKLGFIAVILYTIGSGATLVYTTFLMEF